MELESGTSTQTPFPANPTRKDFAGGEEHAEACLFHPFSPQMSREVVLGNSPRKALFSSLLLTCQEAVACRCLTEPQSCQEVSVRPFTLIEKPPPLCQVPTLAAPSMAPGFHEQHLSASPPNPSSHPPLHTNAGDPMAGRASLGAMVPSLTKPGLV